MFEFMDFAVLRGEEIELVLQEKLPANAEKRYVPAYLYDIRHRHGRESIGYISLRIGDNENIFYGGHIGYEIHQAHRGKRFAAKACRLVKPVAMAHGLKELVITCSPYNIASRRTCEILGAQLQGIVDVPEYHELFRLGEKQKCRYQWSLL